MKALYIPKAIYEQVTKELEAELLYSWRLFVINTKGEVIERVKEPASNDA